MDSCPAPLHSVYRPCVASLGTDQRPGMIAHGTRCSETADVRVRLFWQPDPGNPTCHWLNELHSEHVTSRGLGLIACTNGLIGCSIVDRQGSKPENT